MIKLSKDQLNELVELRDGFKNQLKEINEMSTQTNNKDLLKKIEKFKTNLIKNINEYNISIVDSLKKYDYEVPEYLYIRL